MAFVQTARANINNTDIVKKPAEFSAGFCFLRLKGKIFCGIVVKRRWMRILKKIKKFLPEIEGNVLLKNYTTYKIGGPAKYFFVAKNKDDLIKALKTAKDFNLSVLILGGGSNLLVSDGGFKGLVVKMQISKCEILGSNEVFVGAGMNLTELANITGDAGLSGLEWASGIPGATVGGAIYGHAQAFGKKMSDVVKSVEALNLDSFEAESFSKKECNFSLKSSIFKKTKRWAILSAVLHFEKKDSDEIKKNIKENLDYRKNRQPLNFPSAGSVFVNPEVVIEDKDLLFKFPELAGYNKQGIIPAGYLISKCGLAGKRIGKAQISEKHANFIVNLGGAKAEDVLALIELAKKKVKQVFGIELQAEVQIIGFNHKT